MAFQLYAISEIKVYPFIFQTAKIINHVLSHDRDNYKDWEKQLDSIKIQTFKKKKNYQNHKHISIREENKPKL